MKKLYFYLLFLSVIIIFIISNSLQAKNIHRLISLASGQMIHNYKDTLITQRTTVDEIKTKNIDKHQSGQDSTGAIKVHDIKKKKSNFKIILDTTFKENNKELELNESDSIQKIEVQKLKSTSRKVLLLGSIATTLSVHLYQKRQQEIKENKNIEPKEDDYEFGLIVLLLLLLLIVGRKLIEYWNKWKKIVSHKLSLISKITLKISLIYYAIIALSLSIIIALALFFLFFYIFIFIPFALLVYR